MLMSFQIPYYDEGFDKIFVKYPENFAEMSSDYTDKLVRSMDIPQDNPHHQHTVLDHCARAIFYLDFKSIEYKQELYYATKFHDCGKPLTKTFKDCRGNTTDIAHYYNHQNAGSYLILGCCETVQCADLIMISWLINRHMDPYLNTRYYRNLDIHNKQLIDALHTADIIAH